jgi:FKBP-type peptidyl-prolyl cis-trans isomerase FklB
MFKGLKARTSDGKTRFDYMEAINILQETFSSIHEMRLEFANEEREDDSPADWEKLDIDASYALGIDIGENFVNNGIYPIFSQLNKGLKDRTSGKTPRFDDQKAFDILNEFFMSIGEKRETRNIERQEEFLVENSKRPEVITLESGLQYEIITEAEGEKPDSADTVLVHYEGTLIDGTIFDSSIEREEPLELSLSRVIQGWSEGLQLMSVGSEYKLYIPSYLGYGPWGSGPVPPHATLIFDVEVLDILKNDIED